MFCVAKRGKREGQDLACTREDSLCLEMVKVKVTSAVPALPVPPKSPYSDVPQASSLQPHALFTDGETEAVAIKNVFVISSIIKKLKKNFFR